jgi:hypothetical protein
LRSGHRNVSNIKDIKCLTHFRRDVAAVNGRFARGVY